MRYHALDSLRGFAMFLGIALHAGISFTATPLPFWLVRDRESTPLADVFMFAVHDFRMQTFFLLAGFFGCLLYQKYGVPGTAWHRVKRVVIPFALALAFVVPTVLAAFLYCALDAARRDGLPENPTEAQKYAAGLIAAEPHKSDAQLVLDRFTGLDAVGFTPPGHLWFLYYLIVFYAAALAAAPLLGRLTGTRLLAVLDAAFRRTIEGRWRVVLAALATFPVLLLMKLPAVDTQFRWAPEWHLLLYYGGFFGFGWMLYRHHDLVETFGRGWQTNLLVANLLVLPVALVCLVGGFQAAGGPQGPMPLGWRAGGFAAQALYTWLMIAGLWGAFLRLFVRESAWARYLADASYWCYLASITPTVLFQFAVKDWPLPALLKWVLVTAATLAVLLASYEWCVRYTLVGAVLNGRKYRPRQQMRAAEAIPVESRS